MLGRLGVAMSVSRAVVALCVTALLAGSCSSGSGSSGSGSSSEDDVERLTIAVPLDVGPLGLFGGPSARFKDPAVLLVYDKLLAPSPYVDDPQPWLAEAVSPLDPLTWEVTVRQDVEWHDGQPFSAEDVAFTFDYFRAAGVTGRYTHHVIQVPEIASVEVVSPRVVRFTCAYPCPELGPVTLADLPIIPRHVWEGVNEPAKDTRLPVGTGPYRLVEYSGTKGYRFEANAGYFAGSPTVDELVMPVIEDPSTAFTALRTGEIDATAHTVAPELLEQFRAEDGLDVVTTSPLQFTELVLKVEHELWTDHYARRAVSLAIDREELLETVVLGQGRPATRGYPHPDSPWTSPDLSTPTDPAEAEAVLDGLGWVDRDGDGVRETPEGRPVRFELMVASTEPTHLRAAQLVAEQLEAVGMAPVVRPLDPGSVSGLITSRQFDAMVRSISAHGVADPTQFVQSHLSEVGYLWKDGLPYPELEALLAEWRAAGTLDARRRALFRIQDLHNRQPASIPLYYPDEHWAVRAGAFGGWVESPSFGIVHKWSFLPPGVGRDANATAVRPARREAVPGS
ncbi:MAG: ABC transporter substrate-binding protein [Acidimicrobiia bacterium]